MKYILRLGEGSQPGSGSLCRMRKKGSKSTKTFLWECSVSETRMRREGPSPGKGAEGSKLEMGVRDIKGDVSLWEVRALSTEWWRVSRLSGFRTGFLGES